MERAAVILAAGHGTRMRSKKIKVLHEICGKPLVSHVVDTYKAAGVNKVVVVVGHQAEEVKEALAGRDVDFAWQERQLGTGHAVMQAKEALSDFDGSVVVGYGDAPLYRAETIAELLKHHEETGAKCTVLSAIYDEPFGYGRILRDDVGRFSGVVEEKDASPEQKQISEINTGTYVFDARALFQGLTHVTADNAQSEYYLTDVPAILQEQGAKVEIVTCDDPTESFGINTRVQLSQAASVMRNRILEKLMISGVTIVDPGTTYIDATVSIAPDTIIQPFCILEGTTTIGEDCLIGPHTRVVDSKIGDAVQIVQSTILESQVGDSTTVGPFAYLRPNSMIGSGVRIGDFVEVKNSNIADGAKIPHLSYVGDADIGVDVNMGAGSITCNYDGKRKNRTIVRDHAFVGSNSNLVAPVEIGEGAYIAAGSTINKNVPPAALGIGRSRQVNKEGWVRKK